MTPASSPSALLLRAADRLDERAAVPRLPAGSAFADLLRAVAVAAEGMPRAQRWEIVDCAMVAARRILGEGA